MGHHDVDTWEVWDRVLGDTLDVGCDVLRWVKAILIPLVRKCPVAELRLIWRCVNRELGAIFERECIDALNEVSDTRFLGQGSRHDLQSPFRLCTSLFFSIRIQRLLPVFFV